MTEDAAQRRRWTFYKVVLFVFACLMFSSCGYRLARPENPLLENINTIAVPYFKNKTFEPEAETIFTYAFIDEFVESRRLQVVDLKDADVILYGTVRKLQDNTIAYNSDGKAWEYRVYVSLDLLLEERSSGNVLWSRKKLIHAEEFPVGNNIEFSEAAKRASLKILAGDLAERVHDSIMQGF